MQCNSQSYSNLVYIPGVLTHLQLINRKSIVRGPAEVVPGPAVCLLCLLLARLNVL